MLEHACPISLTPVKRWGPRAPGKGSPTFLSSLLVVLLKEQVVRALGQKGQAHLLVLAALGSCIALEGLELREDGKRKVSDAHSSIRQRPLTREQHSQVGPGPEGIWGASSCSPPAGLPASCEQSPLFPGPPGRGQLWGPAKVGGLEPHLCTGSWVVCTSLLTQWHHHQQHCPGPSCPATTGPCPKKRPARPWPQRQAAELSQSEGVPVSLRQWVEHLPPLLPRAAH